MAQYINKDTYVGDTGKQLKDIKTNADNIDTNTTNIANGLLFRGVIGNLDTLYDIGLYRFANDSSKATSPFGKFNYGQVLVLPYRKGSGNTKTDYVVQIFFGDVDVNNYGAQIYYRFSFYESWGTWFTLSAKRTSDSGERPSSDMIDGKQVFTKTLKFTDTLSGGSSISKAHGITDATRIWVDTTNSYFWNAGVSIPVPGTQYYSNFSDRIGVQVTNANVVLYADTGWGTGWEKVITLKYIK